MLFLFFFIFLSFKATVYSFLKKKQNAQLNLFTPLVFLSKSIKINKYPFVRFELKKNKINIKQIGWIFKNEINLSTKSILCCGPNKESFFKNVLSLIENPIQELSVEKYTTPFMQNIFKEFYNRKYLPIFEKQQEKKSLWLDKFIPNRPKKIRSQDSDSIGKEKKNNESTDQNEEKTRQKLQEEIKTLYKELYNLFFNTGDFLKFFQQNQQMTKFLYPKHKIYFVYKGNNKWSDSLYTEEKIEESFEFGDLMYRYLSKGSITKEKKQIKNLISNIIEKTTSLYHLYIKHTQDLEMIDFYCLKSLTKKEWNILRDSFTTEGIMTNSYFLKEYDNAWSRHSRDIITAIHFSSVLEKNQNSEQVGAHIQKRIKKYTQIDAENAVKELAFCIENNFNLDEARKYQLWKNNSLNKK